MAENGDSPFFFFYFLLLCKAQVCACRCCVHHLDSVRNARHQPCMNDGKWALQGALCKVFSNCETLSEREVKYALKSWTVLQRKIRKWVNCWYVWMTTVCRLRGSGAASWWQLTAASSDECIFALIVCSVLNRAVTSCRCSATSSCIVC